MAVIRIQQLSDSRILPYANLRQTNLTRNSGRFIAEGWRVVERMIHSEVQVESVLISERRPDMIHKFENLATVYVLDQNQAEKLVGYNFHAGVLGCGFRPPNHPLESFLESTQSSQIILACSHLTRPDNLGSIFRLAAAFGVHHILLGDSSVDPFLRRVIRVSMGTIFQLQIRTTDRLFDELRFLEHHGHYTTCGTSLRSSANPIDNYIAPSKTIILLGNEADGLSNEHLEAVNAEVTIPIEQHVDSLNVADATAIFLYHFSKSLQHDQHEIT